MESLRGLFLCKHTTSGMEDSTEILTKHRPSSPSLVWLMMLLTTEFELHPLLGLKLIHGSSYCR